jgi:hypothetical protein
VKRPISHFQREQEARRPFVYRRAPRSGSMGLAVTVNATAIVVMGGFFHLCSLMYKTSLNSNNSVACPRAHGMLRASPRRMPDSPASREMCASGWRLTVSHVESGYAAPANDVCDVLDEVELELRAAWQECLTATDRYVQIARALIDELGPPSSAGTTGARKRCTMSEWLCNSAVSDVRAEGALDERCSRGRAPCNEPSRA